MGLRSKRQAGNGEWTWLFIVLISSTACYNYVAGALIEPGTQQLYELESQVSLLDLTGTLNEKTKYTFRTQLKINSVWNSAQTDEQLLEIFLSESSISAPGKIDGVIVERSITRLPDRPFYISLVKGQPQKVIAHTSRDQWLLNLERSIASLLQLQPGTDSEYEVDVSGSCRVEYAVQSSTRLRKTKTDCSHWDLRMSYRLEPALGVAQKSQEQINYELSADGALLRAESVETHSLSLAAKSDAGSLVLSKLTLLHLATGSAEPKQLKQTSLDQAIGSLLEWYRVFELEADVDGWISELKKLTLKSELQKFMESLQTADVGKSSLALAFAQLVPLARLAKQSDFLELLQQYDQLKPQLMDLLGATQTYEAHTAVFNYFYKKENTPSESLELLEKYLQSLAVATHPERTIIEDLFDRLKGEFSKGQDKLRESILQTLSALTRQSGFENSDSLLQTVRGYLLDNLQKPNCGFGVNPSDCKAIYIRGLQNLQDKNTIDALFEQAQADEPRISVAALQALHAFPMSVFNQQQRQRFAAIFYQQRRRYDSSARVLALNVLLALRPNEQELEHLLNYLNSNDRQFEMKTYVLQKLRMLSELCPRFRAMLQTVLATQPKIQNYHVLAQKGLTTVLTRQLSGMPAFNETLLSVQEVSQGILKRGSVEFLLHAGRNEASSFKLGIYTSGLGSIVGDGYEIDDSNIPADDELTSAEESVTAGMEISVQGAQLRPLTFFNGQTELMGHVWSGTASESTPAYQATTLAQDHEQYIILSSGATLHWTVFGARSVDLNGKVGFSLWNRNAQTEIQQNTGNAVWGHIAVGFTYGKLVQDFLLTHEPKLNLQADLDFYSGIKLCMQLQRPEQLLTYSNQKAIYLENVERVYNKKLNYTHRHKTPGCTFLLNQKNNEMCNMILE